MTHVTTVPETAGEFTNARVSTRPCPKCGGEVRVELWTSSCGGYVDFKYSCTRCDHTWWVDGPDS